MGTVLFSLIAAGSLLARNNDDVDAGARMFRANCANCHGIVGVASVDLEHNKFKQAWSDEDLYQIITFGIPGTGSTGQDVIAQAHPERSKSLPPVFGRL